MSEFVEDPGGPLCCWTPNCWAIFKQRHKQNAQAIKEYQAYKTRIVLVPIPVKKNV